MNLKNIITVVTCILLLSCSSNNNTPEFIEKATGRYLFNTDEVVEVYFIENDLLVKWRGATAIKPLKVNENTFFVKEMNEKIQFLTNPADTNYYMVFVPKKETDTLQFKFRKLAAQEKIPSEYLFNNEFDKALEGYKLIQKNDSLADIIEEAYLNRIGYRELSEKNYKKAIDIFKINVALYPNSSNVYDSYADALKRSGDTILAIENYKKSLTIDSGNRNAKRFVEKYDQKK